jgi:hypothetical protein
MDGDRVAGLFALLPRGVNQMEKAARRNSWLEFGDPHSVHGSAAAADHIVDVRVYARDDCVAIVFAETVIRQSLEQVLDERLEVSPRYVLSVMGMNQRPPAVLDRPVERSGKKLDLHASQLVQRDVIEIRQQL